MLGADLLPPDELHQNGIEIILLPWQADSDPLMQFKHRKITQHVPFPIPSLGLGKKNIQIWLILDLKSDSNDKIFLFRR